MSCYVCHFGDPFDKATADITKGDCHALHVALRSARYDCPCALESIPGLKEITNNVHA